MNDLIKHLGLRIQEAVEEKDWVSVENWAKELLKYVPQKSLGFKWLARASLAQRKMDRAAYAYNRVLDFEPDSEEAKAFFADHARKEALPPPTRNLSEFTEEGNAYLLAPDQKTFLGRAEFEAGVAYESVKMFAEAAGHFRKSFDWYAHPQAALKSAEMFYKAKQSFEAMKLLRETVNANPQWLEGRLLMAKIFFDQGQLTSAQNEWQTVLKIDPRNDEALRHLRGTWDVAISRESIENI